MTLAFDFFAKRDSDLEAARACKNTLTDPKGFWRLDENSERVKNAVGEWVARARRAHAIAMGRVPLIENFLLISGGECIQGSLYATKQAMEDAHV